MPDSANVPQKYTEIEPLGSGGTGQVFQAQDSSIGRRIAVKTLQPELVGDPEAEERFRREARVTGSLEHPNIVPLYSLEEGEQGPLLTMRLISGQNLEDLIEHLSGPDSEPAKACSFGSRVRLILGVCDALEYAHQKGVIHGDLKPANILLGEHGEVQVLDWGFSRDLRESEDQCELAVTPAYCAPELLRGELKAPTSDVYSLGATLYHLITLTEPFGSGSVSEVLQKVLNEKPKTPEEIFHQNQGGVPRELSLVIEKSMAKKPEDRYQTVSEFAAALRDYLDWRSPVVCPHTLIKRGLQRLIVMIDDRPKAAFAVFLGFFVTVFGSLGYGLSRLLFP